MSIGKIKEFDMRSGLWTSYMDRLEMYFKVNKVTDEMKLPTMIASMGDEAYELLVNLASPNKPSELSFVQAGDLMQQHLQPPPSSLAERYRFRQKRQGATEDVATYVAELKKLSRNCKFNTNLNENLRDQFICGLRSDVIRQRLFAENDTINFAEAVKLACSLEAAERDAAVVEGKGASEARSTCSVHALEKCAGRVGQGRGRRVGGAGPVAPTARGRTRPVNVRMTGSAGSVNAGCAACGAANHDFDRCRYRNFVCSKCQNVGHLRRVCPEWKGRRSQENNDGQEKAIRRGFHFGDLDYGTSDEEGVIEDLNLMALNNYKAVSLPILIDNIPIVMEIDTGTAISCINKNVYDLYFDHLPIKNDNTILKFYDGSKIKPLGIIKPSVCYDAIEKQLELFVIENGTTSLIGRQWLAELQIDIPKFQCNFIRKDDKQIDIVLCKLLDRYKELFSGGLGRYRGGKATLRVREGAEPVFHRARPLPYALRERVDAELDAMLRAGVIEPVDCSDWASPLVPVNKADGTLRICADYKSTLNPVLLVDRYPLPRIDDVLVGLNGAQYLSKIDLSNAYNQIVLDDSKKFTVINTHRGLFRYNRLVFGLASSVGIFQRIMTNLLQGIPHVQAFLDDIIIGGQTRTEHLQALEAVLKRLADNGLKLRKDKCVFLVDNVKYLGYVISKDGIKADTSKIDAILKIEAPTNVTELRSFLGMINFYARFTRNLSSLLAPLHSLLRKEIPWKWDSECERAFGEVKRALVSSEVLAHYDPRKPVIVTCDASARGIGGVLAQRGVRGERPVAYASRALTAAEKNYSQIHREALAIIFCVKKFHQYLYGRKFTLRTDHKPLVSIFGPNAGIPTMTASRMQRWAVILSAYDYDIEYIKTNENCADGLSRLPINTTKQESDVIPEQTYLHFAQEALLLDNKQIKTFTLKDAILSRVLSFIRDGWPEVCSIVGMQPYFNRKSELYEELGCVMWGHRVVIPDGCRDKVLKLIHEPHMGIVKSKAIARSYVWWPGIDEAVERECRACATCAQHADAPPSASPRLWPWPHRPWTRLHLDFMGPIGGRLYLVVVDSMSKWLEVFLVPNTSARSTISKLSELWSRFGVPRQIVTDNGPPFTSSEFATSLQGDGVEHVFTAPYHPASNGAAENAVRTLKKVIKKAIAENKNIELTLNNFLLHYRNTEHCSTGESPAILLMGRRLRTRLDALKPDREGKVRESQQRQVRGKGGESREVGVGDDVWYRQYLKAEKWQPGSVIKSTGTNDYKILDDKGNVHHRHLDQLKRRTRSSLVVPTGTRPSSVDPQTLEPDIQAEIPSERTVVRGEQLGEPGGKIGTNTESVEDLGMPISEDFTTPPTTPVPTQPRPVRSCRVGKTINYKYS